MTNFVRKLLKDAAEQGFTLAVISDCGEVDYRGTHPAAAEDAINAVDSPVLRIQDGDKCMGVALIVNGLAEDERIADTSTDDWLDSWWRNNVL